MYNSHANLRWCRCWCPECNTRLWKQCIVFFS